LLSWWHDAGEWVTVAGTRILGWAIAALATLPGAGIAGGLAAGGAVPVLPAHSGSQAVMPPRGGVWQPPEHADWMWELGQPLATSSSYPMGTGVAAYNGDQPPGDDPVVYDIDAIENSAATVAALHRRGDHVICYIEVGSAGNYYTAAQEGVRSTYYAQLKAAGDLGRQVPGYPERFINVGAPSAVAIIESMIGKQCAQKGFDAVETDLDETFGSNEGSTGFTITRSTEETYLRHLAGYMHQRGLGWIAKNLDDTGNALFVGHMEPLAQGIITEQCNQYQTCWLLRPFLAARKWVGNAEYDSGTLARFCARDNAADINGVLFNTNLDGGRRPCR
jgi:hypothetical protein